MKKSLVAAILVLCVVPMAFPTLVTNMNQSTLYLRLLSRNASTDIDAVYYNPAGLIRMKDGWHISLYNQTVFQKKTVVNEFPLLNNHSYDGKVNVPFYPDVFAVYKKGRFALSFGFGPSAGGGSADYSRGLPSFEQPFSTLPALITGLGLPTTKYSVDIAFKGSSVYYGFQLNVSCAVNDIVSAGIGVRYVSAVNTYEGSIKNVMINPAHPLLNPTAQMLPAVQVFTALGQPGYAALVSDKFVDAKQTGSAFTPLLSLNIAPLEGLNIGLKYEFKTSLEMVNDTTKDDTGLFPNGAKTHADIPGFLSLGVECAVLPQLRATVSYNLFFDKFDQFAPDANLNWDGREAFVKSNSYDLGFGVEVDLTKTILVSAGYLLTRYDLAAGYQSDIANDLASDGFGFGARIRLCQKLDLDLGGMYVTYKEASKTFSSAIFGSYLEKYQRSTWAFAVGLGYHF